MGEYQAVDGGAAGRMRRAELRARDSDAAAQEERARRGNTDFVQVYPKGWARLDQLIQTNPQGARVYAFLAKHIDGSCGAVVVSQEILAQSLGVVERTIRRLTKRLEEEGAIVRIKVGTGVYAYALDPTEIWRSWDEKKEHAAFTTKTLVAKKDRSNGQVRRKLRVMLNESDELNADQADEGSPPGDSD